MGKWNGETGIGKWGNRNGEMGNGNGEWETGMGKWGNRNGEWGIGKWEPGIGE